MTSAVETAGLEKSYGRTRAVAGVSLQAGAGITGLLGPNGAGKTTLLRMLATVLAPDSGRLRLLGLDPGLAGDRVAIRRRLGYVPQEPGLHRNFTAFEFVDYVAILKEMADRRSRHDEVRRVLELTGLTEVSKKKIRALSGGMRRRVGLAQALLGNPDLLVLDEPTAGLDPEQRLRFREVVSDIAQDAAVILSTHQTEDVAALCSRVVVMHQGGVQFDGPTGKLAELARNRVWLAATRAPEAQLSWRNADGRHRNIGDAPGGAELVEPTIEDGYLLLVGAQAAGQGAAA
ncbi:MAG TPA: ABC transporter ATP-binding protein [Acidimicrobiales bacterium]|nr:ABC transporter ATP-binding protein [Acidimicrobiales bacterium]